ncbi:MAG: hypothetical protein JRE14_16655 [Deltaproteobacteria bacterium]|nr:hypothetical protein [Deltaproteobacteria bacterium]
MKKMYIAIAASIIGIFGIASTGFCAVDLTGVALDTTTPETLMATVLTGLGVVWGFRKLIKVINRS